MALTIGYEGYGVVANADREVNDTGGSGTGDWRELGGGTIAFNPDVYLFEGGADGAGSMGSKYATKTGYSYIDGITALNFTGVGGNAEDDFVYMWINIQSAGVFATLATNGLAAMIGAATGDSREWKIVGSDDANGWAGGWKCFVIDPQIIAGTVLNGTPDLTAVDTLGIWIDTDVSVRADSIFQAQIFAAKGVNITGTPTTAGKGLDEIVDWCTDYTNRSFGAFEKRGNTYFQKGGLYIGDGAISTTLTADGNNVECEESSYWNGTAWVSSYPSDANKVVTLANASLNFTNVNYSGFIDNKLQWDTSVGNASSLAGGSVKLAGSWSVKSTDTFDGTVFSNNDALSLGAASYDNCTFTECGKQTITATITSFTNNTFKPATGITALAVTNLNQPDGCNFISGGTGYAVDLGTIDVSSGDVSMDWDNILSGYGASQTTNAVILVNITGGGTNKLIINVADTGTSPTVNNTGTGGASDYSIVAGQKTISFTLNPSIVGYEWRMYTVTAKGSLAGAVEVAGEEVAIADNQSYNYSYTVDTPFAIQIISSIYKEKIEYYDLVNSNQNVTITLEVDEND